MGMIVFLALQDKYGRVQAENTSPEPQNAATSSVQAKDVLDAAKEELERINAELDAEEARLLQDIEDAESRLSEIEHVRASLWRGDAITREIVKMFPEHSDLAYAVAMGESRLNPLAYNPEWHYDRHGNKICQGSYGLMQIACVHHVENPRALFDVQFNLEVARAVYDDAQQRRGNGWLPWGAYTDGGYRPYLAYNR